MASFLTGWGKRVVGLLGGRAASRADFKECGQRRGECLPMVRVESAGQGGQTTDALLSPRRPPCPTGTVITVDGAARTVTRTLAGLPSPRRNASPAADVRALPHYGASGRRATDLLGDARADEAVQVMAHAMTAHLLRTGSTGGHSTHDRAVPLGQAHAGLRLARKLARVAARWAVVPQLREAPVSFERTWVGLDVHARSVVVGVIDDLTGK
ncbi:hypothetical protein ACRYCC_30755 [Actinomadura scrupuli]|uniref:hypothetical protein n=1 Tax=Actinomadura scrupuli TaxID=559629 RepID=UPI003D9853AB